MAAADIAEPEGASRSIDVQAASATEADSAATPSSPAKPPPVQLSTCTTLCLWEPDASLMIRKAKGQERARKSEYAAEARRGVRDEKADASGVAEIAAFEEMFAEELRACRETASIVAAQTASDAATQGHFDWWHEQARELHNLVSGASHFLPTNIREKFGKQIGELEAKLKAERERLAPKKKFGFKNRAKVGKGAKAGAGAAAGGTSDGAAGGSDACAPPAATAETAAAAAMAAEALTQVGRDKFVVSHNSSCAGFRSHHGATLTRKAGEDAGADFALDDLTDCTVRLLSASTGLWIRGLRNTTVIAVPLAGFVYISDCVDCTFVLGTRQLRIHTSTECDCYILAASHPILEHCSAMRFAPYPRLPPAFRDAVGAAGLSLAANQWEMVDDFDWLKSTHSPNWCTLPESERRVDFAKMSVFAGAEAGGEVEAEVEAGGEVQPVS